MAGRPTLLLSSSSARVSCSNCTSCSLTDSSRAAALSHCSIHTTRPQGREGRGVEWKGERYTHPYSLSTARSNRNKDLLTLRIAKIWEDVRFWILTSRRKSPRLDLAADGVVAQHTVFNDERRADTTASAWSSDTKTSQMCGAFHHDKASEARLA